MQQHGLTCYAVVGSCTALALFIRTKRGAKTRRLRLGTLWIAPAIFIALVAARSAATASGSVCALGTCGEARLTLFPNRVFTRLPP